MKKKIILFLAFCITVQLMSYASPNANSLNDVQGVDPTLNFSLAADNFNEGEKNMINEYINAGEPLYVSHYFNTVQELIERINKKDGFKGTPETDKIVAEIRQEGKIFMPEYRGEMIAFRSIHINSDGILDDGSPIIRGLSYSFDHDDIRIYFTRNYFDDEIKEKAASEGIDAYWNVSFPETPWTEGSSEGVSRYTKDFNINGGSTTCRVIERNNSASVCFPYDSSLFWITFWAPQIDEEVLQNITFEPVYLRVTIKDAVLLLRYLAGMIEIKDMPKNAFNLSGKPEISDAVRMLREIAGITVED